ncbi:MAG TPA: hypothetical protein VGQ57_02560 [Polyangiaceae bacterium]|nr:hypothetical protein [Polyangiaceae bacterium]
MNGRDSKLCQRVFPPLRGRFDRNLVVGTWFMVGAAALPFGCAGHSSSSGDPRGGSAGMSTGSGGGHTPAFDGAPLGGMPPGTGGTGGFQTGVGGTTGARDGFAPGSDGTTGARDGFAPGSDGTTAGHDGFARGDGYCRYCDGAHFDGASLDGRRDGADGRPGGSTDGGPFGDGSPWRDGGDGVPWGDGADGASWGDGGDGYPGDGQGLDWFGGTSRGSQASAAPSSDSSAEEGSGDL